MGAFVARSSSRLSPDRLWFFVFGIWIALLSGILNPFIGSPGILQAVQLEQIYNAKQQQIDQAENVVIALQEEATRLEKSRPAQEREIRRTLGYAAPGELIFDFSAPDNRL